MLCDGWTYCAATDAATSPNRLKILAMFLEKS
jgi:hypothetical protein